MTPLGRVLYSLILFSLVYKSSSIHCYYCNSANNTACLDVNMYEDEVRSRIVPVVHCESAIPSPVAINFFCRKIIQTSFIKFDVYKKTRAKAWSISSIHRQLQRLYVDLSHCAGERPKNILFTDEIFFTNENQTTIGTGAVFHPHRDSEVRVTRGCGWVPHHKECYKDDNSDHLGTVCQCFQDLCNSSDTVNPLSITVLFLAFSICLYFWR